MTEKNLAEDYRMVLHEAKSMGCNEIKALYNIPLKNMEMIVQALKKQMPKKPKERDCIGFDTLACPECKMALYLYEPYCDNCGQAIDWSDDNDD